MKRSATCLVLSLIFLEWLDFSLYLYLAKAIFAKDFFPSSNYSLLLSFALFSAAYLARPLGGFLFGRRADNKGRRVPMMFSAGLMGISTIGICLIPTYMQVGIIATWGLLLFRMGQGLALGGEINTSAMFLVEHHPQRPLFAGSLVAVSGILGMFLGGVLAGFLQSSMHFHNGWRIIFAIIGILSFWVSRLRKKLPESPEFKELPLSKKNWQDHKQGLFNIAILGAFVAVTVYIGNAFWVSFAIDRHLASPAFCAWIGSLAQLSSALLAIPIAYFSKPSQAYRLIILSTIFAMITGPLLFYSTYNLILPGVALGLISYSFANGCMSASLYYFLYLQLPAHIRCEGISTVWALAASLGALTLPLAQEAMILNAVWVPGALISLTALFSLGLIQKSQTSLHFLKNSSYT